MFISYTTDVDKIRTGVKTTEFQMLEVDTLMSNEPTKPCNAVIILVESVAEVSMEIYLGVTHS